MLLGVDCFKRTCDVMNGKSNVHISVIVLCSVCKNCCFAFICLISNSYICKVMRFVDF
jgi:hypothetical protein